MSLDPRRVDAFSAHKRGCVTCREYAYGYLRCQKGKRLAREMVTPLPYAEAKQRGLLER